MSSNDDDDDDEIIMSSDEDDETMDQNKIIRIENLNNTLDEIIDKSKSFEDQIKSLKIENLEEYWHFNDFDDKDLKFKYFKLKLAHLSNFIDKKLFEQMFGHTLEKLANKLINAKNKEENQIVKNIDKNKKKPSQTR